MTKNTKQSKNKNLVIFEGQKIRRIWDSKKELWYFSIIDIIAVLTEQVDFKKAKTYWTTFKNRLKNEGSELVTNCDQLKMLAQDGKMRFTDVADVETSLRLIQSVPSPKAEPVKLWLAKVGYERMQEISDPEKALGRRVRTRINLAERIQARFKARGAMRCFSIVSDEQRRRLPEFARPKGSQKMDDFCVAPPQCTFQV